jgi:thiol-disulfide isomerase/thioredoxin
VANLRAWKRWPLLRDLAVIAAIVLVVRAYQQRNLPSGLAPALAGADLDGAAVELEDYRGKPVVLHFWATWCGVCKAEQHNLDAVAADLPVLSVASRSGDAAEVAAYVREHEVAPRVVNDPRGALAQRFGVRAFPTTFIVNASGEIEHAEVGYTTELGLRARMWLASF